MIIRNHSGLELTELHITNRIMANDIFEEFDGSKEQNVFMKIFLLCIATIHSDFSVKLHREFLKRKSCDGKTSD